VEETVVLEDVVMVSDDCVVEESDDVELAVTVDVSDVVLVVAVEVSDTVEVSDVVLKVVLEV